MRWQQRLLARVGRYPYHALALTLITTLLAAGLGLWRLRFVSELADLLPARDPTVVAFRRLMENFGHTDTLYLVLAKQGPADPAMLIKAAEEIAARLQGQAPIASVEFRLPAGLLDYYAHVLLPHALVFLPPECFAALARRLTPQAIKQAVARTYRLLSSGVPAPLQFMGMLDPLNLHQLFQKRIQHLEKAFGGAAREGWYYLGRHRKILLVKIRGQRPATCLGAGPQVMQCVQQALSQVLPHYPALDAYYTGGYPIAAISARLMRRDLIFTFVFSIGGVLLLFWLAFRHPWSPLFVGLPLATGIVWAIGLGGALIGRLTLVTTGFAAILAGLGVDFAIHLYNRAQVEQARGLTSAAAMSKALACTLGAILPAALTSSVAFFSFTFTGVRGFTELGLLSGLGILLMMVAMVIMMPALVVLKSGPTRPPWNFGLTALGKLITGRARGLVVLNVLLTLVALGVLLLAPGPAINFQANLRSIRAVHARIVQAEKLLAQEFVPFERNLMILLQAPDQTTLLQHIFQAERILEKLRQQKRLVAYRSLGLLLADPAKQQAMIACLRKIKAEQVVNQLRRQLQHQGFQVQPNSDPRTSFHPYLQWLDQALRVRVPVTVEHLQAQGQAAWLRMFIRQDDHQMYAVIGVVLHNSDDRLTMIPLLQQRLAPLGAVLAGPNTLSVALEKHLAKACRLSALVATAGVVLVVLLWFRNLQFTVLALMPVALGLIWMLALMKLSGLAVTVSSVVALPMILGLGIDDGIHLLHCFRQESSPGASERTLAIAGRAVLLTSLTTLIGFGSLTLAAMQSLQDMGWLCSLGIATCLVQSLVFFPAVLTWYEKSGKHVTNTR